MLVLPFEIPKTGNSAFLFQVDKGEAFYGRLHRHKEIQISLILEGHGDLIINESLHSFAPGELYFIAGNTPHLFRSADREKSAHMISVFFTLDNLGLGFFQIDEMKGIFEFIQSITSAVRFQHIPESLQHDFQLLQQKDRIQKISGFLLFLELLSRLKIEILSEVPLPDISIREGERMRNVMDYALQNYRKKVTLEEFATIAHMTTNAFCRYFKMRTKKTVFQFVNELRIAHADRLLLKADKSVLEIAYDSGFRNISHFNRTFQKYHRCSPTVYKRRNKKP